MSNDVAIPQTNQYLYNHGSSNYSSGILSKIISSQPYPSILFETPGTSLQTSSSDQFESKHEPELQRLQICIYEHFNKYLQRRNGVEKKGRTHSPSNVKDEYHSHLAIFVRNAPQEQISEFWRVAATTQLDILKKAKQG